MAIEDTQKVLDEVSDKVAEYHTKFRKLPTKLNLPIRSACNLMKNPRVFAEEPFCARIWSEGVRAFEGMNLYGCKVKLVIGSEAAMSFDDPEEP